MSAGVLQTGLSVWCKGVAAPPSVAGLTFVGWRSRSLAAASRSFPTTWVLADGDGAVAIPAALVDEVLEEAGEQERMEAWIMEVGRGVALPGLYPMNAETKARYEATRKDGRDS